ASLCEIRERHADSYRAISRQFLERATASVSAARTGTADAGYRHPPCHQKERGAGKDIALRPAGEPGAVALAFCLCVTCRCGGAALGVGEALTWLTPIPNLSMVFLLAVLVTAMSFGIWPAIYASVLSFLVYNFFFIPPIYTFTVAEPYELLALVIFLVVAVVS